MSGRGFKNGGPGQATWNTKGEELQGATWAAWFRRKPKTKKTNAPADFTHRRRRTVSALHWRWGEGRKNSERSRVCSHTSHSYSTRGPGTHSHLQRAPQTLVTVGTCGQGQLWLQVVDTIIPVQHTASAARLQCRIFRLCTVKTNLQIRIGWLICFHTAFTHGFLGYRVHPLHVLFPSRQIQHARLYLDFIWNTAPDLQLPRRFTDIWARRLQFGSSAESSFLPS